MFIWNMRVLFAHVYIEYQNQFHVVNNADKIDFKKILQVDGASFSVV